MGGDPAAEWTETAMPATVLTELARLQHLEAGNHAKFVDMREQAQKTENQLQKLQREHAVETKARKLLDKSLQDMLIFPVHDEKESL